MNVAVEFNVEDFLDQNAPAFHPANRFKRRETFRLTTLGRLRAWEGDAEIILPRTMNARVLLSYLVAHAGQDIARERLIDLFWSEFDVDRARGSLKTAFWLIRKAIRMDSDVPTECLYANKTIVRWDAPTISDRQTFLDAANKSDADSWRLALQLYGGDFLEGHYGEWVDAERTRIANMYEHVLVNLLRAAPDGRIAERLLERNPYNEGAYRILIQEQLASAGFRTAAGVAARCVAALAEVGVTPCDDVLRCLQTPKATASASA